MVEKKPPQKPTNLKVYDCDLIINNQHLITLEISSYYEKHNREYLEALERKKIKLTNEELTEKLITNEWICELVKQLNKEKVDSEGIYYHWTYYSFRVFRGIKAYKLVWCLTEKEPHVLGIMDCYRQRKYDKKEPK